MAFEDRNAAALAAGAKPGQTATIGGGEPFVVQAPTTESSTDPKKTTPSEWDSPKDARQNESAGKYPNYYSHKTRSGHTFMMDDSNGAEHVTMQHRSGSMVQFLPDGCVQIVCCNGLYNIIFAEHRVLVTGAQDIVVQGDASLKIDGNYNVSVKGDTNLTVEGNFNVTAKNLNQTILGNIDTIAKNKTDKIEGSITSQSTGATSIASDAGMMLSSGDSLGIVGENQVGIASNGSELMMKSAGKMSILGKSAVAMRADGGKFSITSSGDVAIDADGTVKIMEGAADAPDDVRAKFVQKPAPKAS
jgi:hypothetical protein